MNNPSTTLPEFSIITDENRRLHRKQQNVMLKDLARKMRISAPYLWDLENGNRAWTDAMRARWDKAMGKQQ